MSRDFSAYETGSHDAFARDWNLADNAVDFVELGYEGVREHESAMDGRGPRSP